MPECQWKQKLRERHRGDWCLINIGEGNSYAPSYGVGGGLCGCGYRGPPPIAYRRRIVRRTLQAELRDEIRGNI